MIQRTIIIGASSGIAKALTNEISKNTENRIILITRNTQKLEPSSEHVEQIININNYSDANIEKAVSSIQDKDNPITRVFICLGILHTSEIFPEKKIEDFNEDAFIQVLTANTLSPMLWLKYLTPRLTGSITCKISVLSARVGSIKDNKLGGWYSYRASKAGLNMLLKTTAIELARRAKNIKVISFHPGTTDTELSKPFQQNVPKGKLFTASFVAKQLLSIVDNTEVDGELSYLDWQGKHIPY